MKVLSRWKSRWIYIYCRYINHLADKQRARETQKEGKQSILEALSPMTASVPFPNRAMIVEYLVVTVLGEDVDGGGGGVAWCVFVSVCVDARTGLCWKTKNSIAFVVRANSLVALSISRQ